jgi:solute carrier family 13 (sodium-dependent dicarboxylate transporter), member 2/3/5
MLHAEQRMKRFGLFAGILVFLALLILPSLGPLDNAQQHMAAVGALMAIWWLTEAIPIPATSLLPLALFPLLGISSMQDAAIPYSNHLIYLFLGGFLLALGIERVNLHKRIALQVIRVIGTSPSRIVLGFMLATAFLSMWISNTATALMMLPIAMAVTKQITLQAPGNAQERKTLERALGMPLLLGIAYAASIGGIGTLIGTPPNIVFAGVLDEMYGRVAEIGFLQWMLFALVLVIIFLPFVWWYLTHVVSDLKAFPVTSDSVKGRDFINRQLQELGKLSKAEFRMLLAFSITALAWIFRTPIEVGDFHIPGLTDIIPALQDSTIAIAAGVLLFLLPSGTKAHKQLMDWDTAQRGIPWGILLLFGGGFALAKGLESSGITLLLGSSIAALQGIPLILLIAIVCFMLTFLTELTSNTATAAVLVPVVATAAIAMGENPLFLMVPATISASFAFMLPVATPPNAIIYSAGWMNIRDMAKAGLILNLVGVVITTLIMYTLGLEVFDITIGVIPPEFLGSASP